MDTWLDLANKSRKSANILIAAEQYRSAINRAYYAVFSKVTMELTNCGVSMPAGWEGPPHKKLRPLIEGKMKNMIKGQRIALSNMVGRLYTLRITADYLPSATIDARDGREAIALMKKIFETI